MAEIYKIRHKVTRLFSTGGMNPHWSETGKIWKSKGALTNHINLVDPSDYKHAEVVVYLLEEIERGSSSVQTIIEAAQERKRKREERSRRQTEKWQRERDLAEFNRLRMKLGK